MHKSSIPPTCHTALRWQSSMSTTYAHPRHASSRIDRSDERDSPCGTRHDACTLRGWRGSMAGQRTRCSRYLWELFPSNDTLDVYDTFECHSQKDLTCVQPTLNDGNTQRSIVWYFVRKRGLAPRRHPATPPRGMKQFERGTREHQLCRTAELPQSHFICQHPNPQSSGSSYFLFPVMRRGPRRDAIASCVVSINGDGDFAAQG